MSHSFTENGIYRVCFILLLRLLLFSGAKGQVCDLHNHVYTESPEIEILKETEGQVSK